MVTEVVKLKINVLERNKNRLKIEIEGEDHTLCNVLQSVLLEDKNVELAGYTIPHPLTAHPIFHIRMKGNHDPLEALNRAVEMILKRNGELKDSLLKALEEISSELHGKE